MTAALISHGFLETFAIAWVCVLGGFCAGAIFANERRPDPTPPRPPTPRVHLVASEPRPYDWQREKAA